jgi:TolB-like protein/tetratricopeptide (TPR) repeat protein
VLRGALATGNEPLNPRRIAVLYFDDRSADKSLDHLTEGLTESLIHELGRVRGLHVIPRNGVRQYRATDTPLGDVARRLNAGTLVTGSIQASAGRLRVMVEMLDGETLQHVQSKVLERPAGELFALEDEIGSEVAGFLRQRLGEEIRVREGVAGTRNSRARDLFLQAERVRAMASETALEVHALDSRGASGLLMTADSMFARAAEMDEQWELPLISRGWVALQRASLVPADSMSDRFREAERLAQLALAVSEDRGPALELRGTARWRLVFLGHITDKRVSDSMLASAAADLQDAVSADPSLARGWSTLSQLLRLRGELAAADVAAERALAEDEFIDDAPLIIERLYRSSFSLARYDKARMWCDRGHRQFPNDWRFLECDLTLMGYDEGTTPSVAAAWRLFDEMSQLDPPDRAIRSARPYGPIYRRMAVARVVARAGLSDSARAMVARARASAANDAELRASLLYDEAYVRLLLGETKTAIGLLEEYVRLKPHFRQYVAHDVQFRRLHGDPRFDAMAPATTGTRP